ncbi:MAG: phosphoribosylamine--glycine ligase [SAR202 cluster bacterium]|nr:phosphoribosylamine--glycine ligase [SAR202 cluster bacterium]
MKVLVVGNGAREHAIAWKLAQSPSVDELLVAPGNAGTAQIARNVPIKAGDIEGLAAFVESDRVDLTVVGPEASLAEGIADRFLDAGLAIFGPTRAAARIESSKAFAKDLMVRHGVPTGASETFDVYVDAVKCVADCQLPIVVKADGLAAGKGVIITRTLEEALLALRRCMAEKDFGAAGERVVIEEFLEGQEVSAFAFVDGEYVSPMVAACDYKRVGDGDEGPNTGGMGSYSPPPEWTEKLERQVRAEVMEPVAKALAAEGSPYRGVLYAGLILTAGGIRVLEFNCRLGDPETQVILPRLKSDLAAVMMGTAQGRLDEVAIEWDPSACVGVVVASGGYPGSYDTGFPVTGLDELDSEVTVFHAGTRGEGAGLVTDGGRVLTVASLGENLAEARDKVYANVGKVRFEGSFYRGDIATFD